MDFATRRQHAPHNMTPEMPRSPSNQERTRENNKHLSTFGGNDYTTHSSSTLSHDHRWKGTQLYYQYELDFTRVFLRLRGVCRRFACALFHIFLQSFCKIKTYKVLIHRLVSNHPTVTISHASQDHRIPYRPITSIASHIIPQSHHNLPPAASLSCMSCLSKGRRWRSSSSDVSSNQLSIGIPLSI